MNKRRWVAIGIAVVLLIFSAISSSISRSSESKKELSQVNELLYGNNEPQEETVEEGSDTEKIAKLEVEGTIINDGTSGLFSTGGYNHTSFMKQLEKIKDDSTVKGILLEINSPGGSVYETAEITRALKEIQKDKKIPIYASMESQAASGGYYIAANSDRIFASEDTMTGSIGVIMSSVNYSGLMEKLGITDATVKSGALKDIGSSSRPQTKEDKEVLQSFVDSMYSRFVKTVAEGRNMDEAKVRKLADGRIYDGAQALDNGLVDEIGYPDQALIALKRNEGLTGAKVISYKSGTTNFMNTWLGNNLADMQGLKPSQEELMTNIVKSIGTPQAPKAMYLYGGE
ncbi:signal peptide peptidase SppA [Enterococcus raffinosus]|uniref:Signal peptide peptidase SppA, 36K type n=2 Tax=Enterococcus raffinosus TaxID=71452 RepID=R2RG26_9ENTE|nr:signal peptide peptidase SppA [Enterococcus raffinosus]EOH79576.1 signal peptide peptidase SppA, 36K type [Enterococcus raffinosus ATCC 49464]EOT71023.1 signal peptide peptidase SppA, 36K type [Enterococcus raffinosus ATCC 49464]MDT2522758.1 signal peptide peptidase SppA [Enterococcus raffinosus]MDT2531136.1 signal peptide peptidase SppA [Enterococcus raffinosus]MDT2532555.1 signal peptide peptidase SppA [Enterococcus raffinosus]